jgi:regulator of sigma E protease
MEILIKILQFVAALSLLILVHELGHFLFAKMFKCRVEKFYLFFNPWFTLFKFKVGETEYGIGWLPLGGYCKIAGMIDESMDTEALKEEPKPWEFRSKPAWQRLLIMVGGVLMNVVLAIVVYTGMLWHWGESYFAVDDVNNTYGFEFSEAMQSYGFRNGDKILNLDGKTFENSLYLKFALLLDNVQSVEVERDGQIERIPMREEYVAAMLKDPILAMPYVPLVVDSVLTGTGAEAAGLLPGDRIVTVDGKNASHWIGQAEYAGRTVPVGIERKAADTTQTLTLSIPVAEDGTFGFLPVHASEWVPVSSRSYDFFSAIPAGLRHVGFQTGLYVKQIGLMFKPKTEAYKSLGGFITIGNIFPGTWDWYNFWRLTAMLSIMLAVMNMLPIPALDGGHVLFVLWEMITRRKPGDKFLEHAQVVGLVLLLLLMVYANGNDIVKLFSNKP